MRQETQAWWRQATAELETARINLDSDQYYAASWFCQQAAEKALKALYIEQTGTLAPKIHDLVRLGNLVSAPGELHPALTTLNDVLATVRYPAFGNAPPVELVTREESVLHIAMATGVLEWTSTNIQ